MSSQRRKRALEKEAGIPPNQGGSDEVIEVNDAIASGAEDDDFMDDVDEPLDVQRVEAQEPTSSMHEPA